MKKVLKTPKEFVISKVEEYFNTATNEMILRDILHLLENSNYNFYDDWKSLFISDLLTSIDTSQTSEDEREEIVDETIKYFDEYVSKTSVKIDYHYLYLKEKSGKYILINPENILYIDQNDDEIRIVLKENPNISFTILNTFENLNYQIKRFYKKK